MRSVLSLILLAVLPTVVLSAVGILVLVYQREGFDIAFGILILVFSVALLSGAVVLHSVGRRQVRTAMLKTDFVAKVSHELRTPLASIRMFVDTLREGNLGEEEARLCLDTLSAETSRLSSLIERLLSWGRMESGKQTYDLWPELVQTLVAEAVAQVEPQIAGGTGRVVLELGSEPLAVRADRKAVVEALLNLLSNAFKYGGTRVVVRAQKRGDRVQVDVEDDGPGVPREEQRKIFHKFYRGRNPMGAPVKGSGLGLAMARHVVRAHGGRLSLHSEPGHGACFTLSLPMVEDPREALEIPPE